MSTGKSLPANYLKDYLKVAPISHSVWRAAEAKELSKIDLPPPTLDVGCGFGEFAGVFFDSMIEVGIDISLPDVLQAKQGKKYRRVECIDAKKMPFRSNSFASILSVSVLEHISRVDEVLAEIYRVLKVGGIFIFTVPSNRFSSELIGHKFFKAVGLNRLSRLYSYIVNLTFRHHNLWSKATWEKQLRQQGFTVNQVKSIVPFPVFRVWELGLPLALPSQLGKLLWGKRFVVRPPGLVPFLTLLLRPLSQPRGTGTNWLIIARK